MTTALQASFYLRSRYESHGHAQDKVQDHNTEDLIESACSLAKAWIEASWKAVPLHGDVPDQRITTVTPMPNEALPSVLREFWYWVILAAKMANDDLQQQHVVDFVSEKKNIVGTLQRWIAENGNVVQGDWIDSDCVEIAETPDGELWSDLPYVKSELFDTFLRSPPLTDPIQWNNLNAFAARMTAANIRDLSFYAISAFYEALEMEKFYPVSAFPDIKWFDPAVIWFRHCGKLIYEACKSNIVPPDQCHDEYSCRWHRDEPPFVGILAVGGGIKESGFSMARWEFWKRRLDTIREESSRDTTLQSYHEVSEEMLNFMRDAEVIDKS